MTQERKAEAQEDASVSSMTPGSTHPKKPRGRQSRGAAREHKSTGARTSGIVGMLGPVLLVDVPAALWNAGPRDTGGRTSGIV